MSRAFNLTLALIALSPAPRFQRERSAGEAHRGEIVDKNIAARGGIEKWRAVQTLSWSGKLDAGGGNRADAH